MVVTQRLSDNQVNGMLDSLRNVWVTSPDAVVVSFRNAAHIKAVLQDARKLQVEVRINYRLIDQLMLTRAL